MLPANKQRHFDTHVDDFDEPGCPVLCWVVLCCVVLCCVAAGGCSSRWPTPTGERRDPCKC
jgi:hypothetical protein